MSTPVKTPVPPAPYRMPVRARFRAALPPMVLSACFTLAAPLLQAPSAPAAQPAGSGVLSAAEAGLDCRKMAGRMQVRLLELRGGSARPRQSDIAQSLKKGTVSIFGGSTRGSDASADDQNDIAKLRAMNDLLKSRNCAYYDIDAELAKGLDGPTPTLIRPGSAAKKKPTDKTAEKHKSDAKKKQESKN